MVKGGGVDSIQAKQCFFSVQLDASSRQTSISQICNKVMSFFFSLLCIHSFIYFFNLFKGIFSPRANKCTEAAIAAQRGSSDVRLKRSVTTLLHHVAPRSPKRNTRLHRVVAAPVDSPQHSTRAERVFTVNSENTQAMPCDATHT